MNHKQNLVDLLSSFPNVSTAPERQTFIDTVGLTKLAKNIDIAGNIRTFFNTLIDVVVKTDGPEGLLHFIDSIIACYPLGIQRIDDLKNLKTQLQNLDSRQWHDDFGYITIPDPVIIEACPYQGLFAFGETNAQYFFGREAVAEQLVTAAESRSLVAVIGASGSGKSSVVFAGLIPQLRKQGKWAIASFRPGDTPFKHLASALVGLLETQTSEVDKLLATNKLTTALLAEEVNLADVIGKIAENQQSKRVLLVADQFEELYALCREKPLRQSFLECLLKATNNQPNFTLVLTLRADFCGYALSDRSFADALQNADLKLGPMNRQELGGAIIKPAAMLGVRLESGLSDRILEAVGEEPGNLPLLQFALTKLWEKQSLGQLTHIAYDEIGGVEQALVKYADEEYKKFGEKERERVRRAFIQLVSPGEGTQDTRRLATAAEVGAQNWDLIKVLADSRLVVTGSNETGEETVEVIHEALIREWGTLREWMEGSREFRTWQTRLRERMREWEKKNKDEGELLRGASLLEAQEWHEKRLEELSLEEQEFIRLSGELREREERERRRKLLLTILGLGTFSLVAAFGWWNAFVGRTSAELRDRITNLELSADTSLEQQLEAIAHGKKVRDFPQADTNHRVRAANLLQKSFDFEQWKERNTLEGHKDRVFHVSFSHDGKLIASASEDKTVRLWKPDGTPVATLKGHQKEVFHVSFSPDDNLIASASGDGIVRLWTRDGTLAAPPLTGHNGPVHHTSFSPDGNLIASASDDKTVRLWTREGTLVRTLTGHEGWVSQVSFSHDGNLIASASEDKTVRLWKPDGTPVATLKGHQAAVRHVSFSHDDNLIASASDDKTVRLWTRDGTLAAPPLTGHGKEVYHVSFSHDDNLIASASWDGTVRLWKPDGTAEATLTGHEEEVNHVSFSPDGNLIASASRDKTVRLWTREGKETLKGHQGWVLHVSFSPTDNLIASASQDNTVRLWKPDGTEVTTLQGYQYGVWHVSFSPDSNLIAFAGDDGTVLLWKPDGTLAAPPLKGHEGWVRHVSFSPDGKLIASASRDGTVRLWNANDGTPATEPLIGHKGPVSHVSFSHDGKLIASASEDKTVRLWKPDGTAEATLTGHEGLVNQVSFSPDGNLIASASYDKTVRLWKPDGTPVRTLKGHEAEVFHVSFSPDGNLIASASNDKTVRLWNTKNDTPVRTLKGHLDWVLHVSFSPDGKLIASASGDGTVRLWTREGKEVTTLQGHQGYVRHVSFSHDGKLIASASADDTVRLWTREGKEVATLKGHQAEVRHVSFSPDGKLIASASDDGTVRLWKLDVDSLLIQGCDWVRDYLNTLPEDHENKHLCNDIYQTNLNQNEPQTKPSQPTIGLP